MYTIHKLHPLATHVYCVPGKHLSTNANQWGFLPRKSTITAILSAAYNWSTALEEGKEKVLYLLTWLSGVFSQPLPICSKFHKVLSLIPYSFIIHQWHLWCQNLLVLYVDDIFLYWTVHSPDAWLYSFAAWYNTLGAWSSTKKLKFNPTEWKTIFISHRRSRGTKQNSLFLKRITHWGCWLHQVSWGSALSWTQQI